MYIQTQRIIYLTIDLEKLSAFFRAAAPPSDEVNGLILRTNEARICNFVVKLSNIIV